MKYEALDSLRGVAAVMVVLFHLPFLTGERSVLIANSALFVDFFFVLSGFVICFAYAAKIENGLGLSHYLVLRLGRIFPLHAAVLTAWAAIILAAPDALGFRPEVAARHDAQSFMVNLFLLTSIGLESDLNWNHPSWSISAELFAYIAFFLAVSALRQRLTGAVALCVSMSSFALLIAANGVSIQRHFDLGVLRCFGGFFLGVALYRFADRLPVSQWAPGTWCELAVMTAVIILLLQPPGSVTSELTTITAFAAAVAVFSRSRGLVSTALRHPVPAFLGRVSYSIYLVHALVIALVTKAFADHSELAPVIVHSPVDIRRAFYVTPEAGLMNAAILFSVILISAGTYRWVEQPGRAFARRLCDQETRGAAPNGLAPRD